MNSFTGWIGGKKLLRKEIIKRFPESFDRYIEVFGGAGWVLFGKNYDKKLEVFNDIDSNLINLYRCIKYHPNELQKELEWIFISRENFYNSIEQLKVNGLTDIQKAARYFYVVKASFGNDRRSFGTNKKNLIPAIEYLEEIHKRLQSVVIENKKYSDLIKVYDRPNALFYLDPPYLGTEKYYDGNFELNDHKCLKAVLSNIKGKFILSYNDTELINELYSEFYIEHVSRNNNMGANVYKEVIIRNYK